MQGVIIAVCISGGKGTPKQSVHKGQLVENHGLAGDAHAGSWHRQVSLLSREKVEEFRARGATVPDGAFGENLLVSGIDVARLSVGTCLSVGGARLEVTQIGKECHARCAIYQQMGDCIMPREGIFARVTQGGDVAEGDILYVDEV